MAMMLVPNREQKNIKTCTISNKEKYFSDLVNLEMSLTGRIDSLFVNSFILESVQMIVNSITLFEQGYFDAAFYSLRQSLELSTTMVYLSNLDKHKKEEKLKDWKDQSKFPQDSHMSEFLKKNEIIFSEIALLLSEHFTILENIKKKLNKYVHKQGFQTFYVMRNNPFQLNIDKNEIVQEFEEFLIKCIGSIGIFRLAIDPLPLLLSEHSIYIRTEYLITESFSKDFLDFYIGRENCEKLKQTTQYHFLFNEIMQIAPKNEFTTYVVKDRFIDKEKIDEILSQSELLSLAELTAVFICSFSDKISLVYADGIFDIFFSSTKSNRTNSSWDSKEFEEIRKYSKSFNLSFDNVYISKIQVHQRVY